MTDEVKMTYTQTQIRVPYQARGHKFHSRHHDTVLVDRIQINDTVIYQKHEFDINWFSCAYCGDFAGIECGEDFAYAKTSCQLPGGKLLEYEIPFPSGKIVVNDSLRAIYTDDAIDDDKFASYNSLLGQWQYSMAMVNQGCAFGPVGNSCPGIYRQDGDKYVIGNSYYTDEDDEDCEADLGERVGGVTTDLWAYMIADLEHFKFRGGDPDAYPQFGKTYKLQVIDITPGMYRFRHYTTATDFDYDSYDQPTIYAEFFRVGNA